MATTELVSVDFHGDSILATQLPDGRIAAVVKRICESLGLDFSSQISKLKKAPWGGVVQITTPDSRGVEQETYVIPVDSLPMWLVTIVAGRVREDVRPKLVAYQIEAAKVLARHFLGSTLQDKVQPAAPVLKPWSERLKETWTPHHVYLVTHYPDHHTVLDALFVFFLHLEDELFRHMLQPQASDRPDVSVGLLWARDRRRRGLPPADHAVPLYLPDVRREVHLCVYHDREKVSLENWFKREYLPNHLPNYLTHKESFKAFGKLPPSSAADHTCLTMSGCSANLDPVTRRQLKSVGGFFPAGRSLPIPERRQPMLLDLR